MIEINNLTRIKIDKIFLKKVAHKILKKEKKSLKLSIALVNQGRIRKLNREYRRKNKTTDVLSFSYDSSGEIIICPQEVRKSASQFGTAFKKELTKVLIHGILHLLGYDHEASAKKAKKIEEKQEYYLNSFF